jgi:hypothetical protein
MDIKKRGWDEMNQSGDITNDGGQEWDGDASQRESGVERVGDEVDHWRIVILKKPADGAYISVLNDANARLLGGGGNAGDPDNPIQFEHGLNWMLNIASGREDARVVVGYMKGRFEGQGVGGDFEALVRDYRSSFKDA